VENASAEPTNQRSAVLALRENFREIFLIDSRLLGRVPLTAMELIWPRLAKGNPPAARRERFAALDIAYGGKASITDP
jgi:hypothetical protein